MRHLLLTAQHPFVWVVRVTAVLVLVVFTMAALRLFEEGDAGLGWTDVRRGGIWYVASVSAAGPAAGILEPGDRLIAFEDDRSVARVGADPHRRALQAGDSYRLRIARGDAEREVTLAVRPTPGRFTNRLSWFLVSLIWCGIGLFMGFVRPDRPMARLAFLAACAVGLVFIQVGVLRWLYLWQPAHMVLGYHFFYRFPGAAPPGVLWTALLWALYAGCALPFAVGQMMNWLQYVEGPAVHAQWMAEHQALMSARQLVGTVVADLALLGMVAVIARNYWRLGEPDQRRRIRWVVYFSLVGLVPQFWYMVVGTAQLTGGLEEVPLYGLFVNAATCLIPISVAYAVVKHRLFDIKVVVRRGLQYLLARRILQLLLVVPVAALAYTLFAKRDRTIAELMTENVTNLSSIALLGVGLRFRNPLRLWLDRRFFREQYDSEQVLIGLVDQLARSESTADLSRHAHTQIDLALHPKAMHLWHADSAGDPDAPPATLETILERQADAVQVSRLTEAGARDTELDRFAMLGWQLIVPIRSSDERLVSALMLGEKKSEEPYSANDRRLLQAIAKQIAIVWDNLRLQAQVGEEQRIRHVVLAKLDRDAVKLLKECPACGTCYDAEAERCDHDDRPLVLSLPVGRTIEGRYRLDRLIGKGGMGAVYDARDLRLERRVAVKIMVGRAFGDEQALRRFQREARAVARLNHPNIVSVHDCGSLAGEAAYLVMERLDGVTLRAELGRAGVLAPGVAADWFDQLLAGVAAAHEHGVVHRDLKPENVIADRQASGSLTVKILDFGLAKFRPLETAATGTFTIGGAIMGTMGYMSPEQLLGGDVDERSDLFTVGVMLVEVLTGSRPFAGTSYLELLSAVTSQRYQLPGPLAAVTALDDLVRRCLAKDRAERVASAAGLRQELIPVLRACPPLAATPQPGGADAETETMF